MIFKKVNFLRKMWIKWFNLGFNENTYGGFNMPLKDEVKRLDSLKKMFCSLKPLGFGSKYSDLRCEAKKATVIIVTKTYA